MFKGSQSIISGKIAIEGAKFKKNSWIGYIAVKNFKYFKILMSKLVKLSKTLLKIVKKVVQQPNKSKISIRIKRLFLKIPLNENNYHTKLKKPLYSRDNLND